MFEMEKTEEIKNLISIAKSDSGISGPRLAKAHMRLGELLGEQMKKNTSLIPQDTTVVAILRSGIFFAEGLYFALGCQFEMYNPKIATFERPATKNVILADGVINTGKTMQALVEPDMLIACTVINEKTVPTFADQLYTVRVSTNSYVGADVRKQVGEMGPDTTGRLFNLI